MLDHFFVIGNTIFVKENYLRIVDMQQSVALDQVHHATQGVRNLAIETWRLGGMVVASGVAG